MAFNTSSIFRAYLSDVLNNTTAMDWVDDASVLGALFNNSITPDNDATAANSAFDAGQWDNVNEVADGTEWDAGGEPLTSRVINLAADTITLDAADTPSGGTSATLTAYGIQVYDDTIASPVANQGFCFNDFGGVQTVTDGTFIVQWHATQGVMQFTVAAA